MFRRALRGRGLDVLPGRADRPPRQGGAVRRRRRRAVRSYLSHRLAFPLANYPAYVKTGDPDLIRPFEAQPEFLAWLAGRDDWAWRHDLCVFTDDEKRALYAPDLAAATKDFSTGEHLRRAFASLTATDPLNRISSSSRTFFPDQVLTFVDRLSMAHSLLEVRSAFLDTDVVTFVAGLPGRLKIKNGETKSLEAGRP